MNGLEYLMNFGLGAIFAGIMFVAYKGIVKQMREDRKYMQDCLAHLIDRYDATINERTKAVIENTKIQSELLTWLKAKNGNR